MYMFTISTLYAFRVLMVLMEVLEPLVVPDHVVQLEIGEILEHQETLDQLELLVYKDHLDLGYVRSLHYSLLIVILETRCYYQFDALAVLKL